MQLQRNYFRCFLFKGLLFLSWSCLEMTCSIQDLHQLKRKNCDTIICIEFNSVDILLRCCYEKVVGSGTQKAKQPKTSKERKNFHLSPWRDHWKITFKPRSHSVCLNLLVLLLVLPLKAAAAILVLASERQVIPQMHVILLAKNCMCLEKSFRNHKGQLSISTALQLSCIQLCG